MVCKPFEKEGKVTLKKKKKIEGEAFKKKNIHRKRGIECEWKRERDNSMEKKENRTVGCKKVIFMIKPFTF